MENRKAGGEAAPRNSGTLEKQQEKRKKRRNNANPQHQAKGKTDKKTATSNQKNKSPTAPGDKIYFDQKTRNIFACHRNSKKTQRALCFDHLQGTF